MAQPERDWISPNDYAIWRDCIRSGQVPNERVPGLLAENPLFAIWLDEAESRRWAQRRSA